MDKDLIRRACCATVVPQPSEKQSCSMLSSVQQELEKQTPSAFLVKHNTDLGANLMKARWTPGRLLLRENAPTLHDVAKVYGEATALSWLNVQLLSVDSVLGAMAFGEEALREGRQLIYAKYMNVPVVALALFFGQYKAGDFAKEVEKIGGIQKVMVALGSYMRRAQDEANKLIYEQEIEEDYRRRMSYGNTAVESIRR